MSTQFYVRSCVESLRRVDNLINARDRVGALDELGLARFFQGVLVGRTSFATAKRISVAVETRNKIALVSGAWQ